MSVLWCGGEDIDFPNGSSPTVSTTGGRFRSTFCRCCLIPASIGNTLKSSVFPGGSVTSAWLTGYLFITAGGATQRTAFGFGKSGTNSGLFVGFNTSSSAQLSLNKYDGTTITNLATEVGISPNSNGLSRIDMQLISYGASATVNVYVNGALVITFTGDVTVSGVTNVDSVFMRADGGPGTFILGISEVMVADEDTRGWPGLMTLAPTSTGTTSNWTNNTVTNINGITISDTNPASSNTNAQQQEYNITDLPAGTFNIKAVKIAARLAKSSSPAVSQVELGYNDGGTVAYGSGATKAVTTAYATYEQLDLTNPNGAVAWAQSVMNGLQLDIKALT